MFSKKLTYIIHIFIVILIVFTGCDAGNLYIPAPEPAPLPTYKEIWEQELGKIDPQQTWQTVISFPITVEINQPGSYTLQVYNKDPRFTAQGDTLHIMAEFKLEGNQASDCNVDVPLVLDEIYLALISENNERVIRTLSIADQEAYVEFGDPSSQPIVTKKIRNKHSKADKTIKFGKESLGRICGSSVFGKGYRTKKGKYLFLIYQDTDSAPAIGATDIESTDKKKYNKILWKQNDPKNTSFYKMSNQNGICQTHHTKDVVTDENFDGFICTSTHFDVNNWNYHALYAKGGTNREYSFTGTKTERFYYSLHTTLPVYNAKSDTYQEFEFEVVAIAKPQADISGDYLQYQQLEYIFVLADDVSGFPDYVDKDKPLVPDTEGSSGNSGTSTVTRSTYTLVCEDLGSVGDRDFNDVVLRIEYTNGDTQATVTPLAAGGTLPATILLNDISYGEIHKKFGMQSVWVINGYNKGKPAKSFKVDVPPDFSMADKMGGFRIKVNNKEKAHIISAPDTGDAPLMLCMVGDWTWPREGVFIERAYPYFKNWNCNAMADPSWYRSPNTSLLVK